MACSRPATATASTGRCAETRRASPPWCCTAAPARAASRGTGGMFDPARYRIVLLDQRGCGRSTPARRHGSRQRSRPTPHQHLLADIEACVSCSGSTAGWCGVGRSGCELALAYAERHPSGSARWCCGASPPGAGARPIGCFAAAWAYLPRAVAAAARRRARARTGRRPGAGLPTAAGRPRPGRAPQARRRTGAYGSRPRPDWPPRTGLAERYRDPAFALGFARLVTHYVHHDHWIEDGSLLRDVGRLAAIPAVLIQGRFDFQSPLRLGVGRCTGPGRPPSWTVVDDGGHGRGRRRDARRLIAATDRFAGRADRCSAPARRAWQTGRP